MKLAGVLTSALMIIACCTVTSCGGAGPAQPGDGTYRLMPSGGATGAAMLTLDGSTVCIDAPGQSTTWSRGTALAESLLCPPRGQGQPVGLIGGPVTLAGTTFDRPATFGDCGVTRPVRVTLVDLDSATPAATFGFSRWVAFCDTKDPDC